MSTSSNIQTNAGTTISIVAEEPATYDQAVFLALVYTYVGEIVNAGSHGPTFAEVTHSPLDRRVVNKRKGSVNMGTMDLNLGMDLADAGQILLIAATEVGDPTVDCLFSVRITYQNTQLSWFTALIMSYSRDLGTIDQIIGASVSLSITNEIVNGTLP